MGINIMKALAHPEQAIEQEVQKIEATPAVVAAQTKVVGSIHNIQTFAAKIDIAKLATALGVAAVDVENVLAEFGTFKSSIVELEEALKAAIK